MKQGGGHYLHIRFLTKLVSDLLTIYLSLAVSYLAYGPYGSFGPTYDSSMSNITKEDSQLLMETYGSDAGMHYAKR